MYQPASTPTIRTDPAKFARNRIGRARIKPAIDKSSFGPTVFYFLAVAVISIWPCPTSLATTTVARVGRGSLKYDL